MVTGRHPDDLVFRGLRGDGPLRVSTFRTAFGAAAATIGVPDLYPHQLRHTAASLAIASGADVKVIQQMLGHGSATMTLDTYGHLFDNRLDEVAEAMAAAREAERAAASHGEVPVAPVLPERFEPHNAEETPSSVSAGQSPFRSGTPDRIRTGATAVRGRRARPLHNGGKHVCSPESEEQQNRNFSHSRAFRTNSRPLNGAGNGVELGY